MWATFRDIKKVGKNMFPVENFRNGLKTPLDT